MADRIRFIDNTLVNCGSLYESNQRAIVEVIGNRATDGKRLIRAPLASGSVVRGNYLKNLSEPAIQNISKDDTKYLLSIIDRTKTQDENVSALINDRRAQDILEAVGAVGNLASIVQLLLALPA